MEMPKASENDFLNAAFNLIDSGCFAQHEEEVQKNKNLSAEESRDFLKQSVDKIIPFVKFIYEKKEELEITDQQLSLISTATNLFIESKKGTKDFSIQDVITFEITFMIFVSEHREAVNVFLSPDKLISFLNELPTNEKNKLIYSEYTMEEVEDLYKKKELTIEKLYKIFLCGDFFLAYEKKHPKEKTYRTKQKADEQSQKLAKCPNNLVIPTLDKYLYSLSFSKEGDANLQNWENLPDLKFENGRLSFGGNEITAIELVNNLTNEGIENINVMDLRVFYSIYWSREQKDKGLKEIDNPVDVYIPDLAKTLGIKSSLNQAKIDEILARAQSFQHIKGYLKYGNNQKSPSFLYVLVVEKYNAETNTLTFSSPYMKELIKLTSMASQCKDKSGKAIKDKKGNIKRIASQSFLIDSSIAKEKNQAAAENVILIVQGIERAGEKGYHVSANTLIERNPYLLNRINKDPSHKGQTLKRAFKKTWELLRTKTKLEEYYKNIKLPDPNDPKNIPTSDNVNNFVIDIVHEGKIQKEMEKS